MFHILNLRMYEMCNNLEQREANYEPKNKSKANIINTQLYSQILNIYVKGVSKNFTKIEPP